MKNTCLLILCFLAGLSGGFCQQAPDWTRSINAGPDTAYVVPVRVLADVNGNVYVLSRYIKNQGPLGNRMKIFLHKYHSDGSLEWSFVYDSASRGQPIARDMAMDDNGNCYISGSFYTQTSSQPILLMKVTTAGTFSWLRDSTTAFQDTDLDQVIVRNGKVHIKGYYGLAVFDTTGAEQWAVGISVQAMAVDRSGNTIITANVGAITNFFKFDNGGNVVFSDSSLNAGRIAIDDSNNIYLMTDFSQYELAAYDSAGSFRWNHTNFPAPPPFGDFSYDVLIDLNGDILAVGLSDTMYKFTRAGTQIWQRAMDGLDGYIGRPYIAYGNLLGIVGSVSDANGYNMEIRLYNLNGQVSWTGSYNGVVAGQEYAVDAVFDGSGIYGVETSEDSATLVKFITPFFLPVDYSLVCVDSIWYDPLDTLLIHVRVFNGSISHLNYPVIQIVSPLGDTISNPTHSFSFFSHMGNGYLEYVDSITVAGITDFSLYTFAISEGVDTTAVIGWCLPLGLPEIEQVPMLLFPNPAQQQITLDWPGSQKPYKVEIFDRLGAIVQRMTVSGNRNTLDISGLSNGLYFLRVVHERGVLQKKFLIVGN